jgi:hypothetical protein
MTAVVAHARPSTWQRCAFIATLAACLTACCLLAFGAGEARALDHYVSTGELPGTFARPAKIAVDDVSHDVFVVDAGNQQVQVWGPGGVASASVATIGGLTSPYGIAINQGTGDVYVADAGANQVQRYVPDDRANPTVFTLDPTFTSPAQGTNAGAGEIGSFASPITVDPANGNVLILDTGNKVVSRFDATGGFISSFSGAGSSGGAFQNPLDLVVGDGVTYVLDTTIPYDPFSPNTQVAPGGRARVERFDSSGASLGALTIGGGAQRAGRNLAYGVATHSLFVVEQGISSPGGVLHILRDGAEFQSVDYPAPADNAAVVGVAVDDGSGSASGRVYGVTDVGLFGVLGSQGVEVFDRLQFPDATTDPVSDIGQHSARLHGTVDPIHGTATFHLEYCAITDPCDSYGALAADPGDPTVPDPGNDPANPWKFVGDASADHGTSSTVAHPEGDATLLEPFSEYKVRVAAVNGDGANVSATRTFRTLGDAPVIAAEKVTDRQPSSATLRAQITPYGQPTTFHVEYGLTTSYGFRAPASNERTAGDGHGPQSISQAITGLQAGATYHWRVVAQNASGVTSGADQTFATPTASPASRVYELVSPADKAENNVRASLGMQASEDGNTMAYVGSTVLGGQPDSAPLYPRYVAHRTASGWISKNTDPAQAPLTAQTGPIKVTVGVSDDGTKAVVVSLRKLAAGAVEGDTNLYLRDVSTGAYTFMGGAAGDTLFKAQTYTTTELFVDGTPNFDHVLLLTPNAKLLPGVVNGALYEFSNGQLRVASVSPNGTSLTAGGIATRDHGRHVISRDGSRFVFGATNAVYIRSGGVTRPMSVSHRSSDPGTLQPGRLVGGSRDTRYQFFFSSNLTDDSTPDTDTLYRYDANSDSSQMIARTSDSLITNDVAGLQVSDDGSTVVFASTVASTPDAVAGWRNLYVWRNGTLSLIAPLDPGLEIGAEAAYAWWLSPDGRYFAFTSGTKLTSYDPASTACVDGTISDNFVTCRQVYRYDADTHQIGCASCRPDGKAPIADAYLSALTAEIGTHSFVRSVNNSGQVFLDTPEELVPGDTNATWDVYEYDGDHVRLVSSGRGTGGRIADVSLDGRDVFFTTQERLVRKDTDTAVDLYDARIGGGIPGEDEESPGTACASEDCRTVAEALPAVPAPTEMVTGVTNRSSKPPKAKISGAKGGFKGTVLRLSLTVSGAGAIRVSGAKVVAVKRTVSKAGTYTLDVKLTSKQRSLRRRGHRVKAAMTITFTPVFGSAVKSKLTRTAAR